MKPVEEWPMIQNAKRMIREHDEKPEGPVPPEWQPLPGTEIAVGHLVIVNEENAETSLIAIISYIRHTGECEVQFIAKYWKDKLRIIAYDKAQLTPIAEFGVEVITDGKHYKVLRKSWEDDVGNSGYVDSKATYLDGKPRDWQEPEPGKIVRGRKKLLKLSLSTGENHAKETTATVAGK
jgi:hypothetical protein